MIITNPLGVPRPHFENQWSKSFTATGYDETNRTYCTRLTLNTSETFSVKHFTVSQNTEKVFLSKSYNAETG